MRGSERISSIAPRLRLTGYHSDSVCVPFQGQLQEFTAPGMAMHRKYPGRVIMALRFPLIDPKA